MDDKDIIRLYGERSERAIAESRDKYGGYCGTIARNILSDSDSAEECVSDALIRAWETHTAPSAEESRYLFGENHAKLGH